MTHDDHQRNAQHADRKFDGAQGGGVYGVAGVAYDEELAQTPPEQQLGRHPAVRT